MTHLNHLIDNHDLNYEVMDRKEMSGSELISKINDGYSVTNGKTVFLFNGRPYQTADRYIRVDNGKQMVQFRYGRMKDERFHGILRPFYEYGMVARSEAIEVEDIIGYEVVDVWDGKYFVGTYRNVLVRKED